MNWLARESPANALCVTYSLPFRDGIFFATVASTGASTSSTTGATVAFFGAAFFALFRATGVGVTATGSTTKAESESSGATISGLRDRQRCNRVSSTISNSPSRTIDRIPHHRS